MSSASAPLLEDDTIAFGDDLDNEATKGSLTHPYVTFFHLAFRIASIFVYLLCGMFGDSFIASFVIIVLLLSMDFWTVKNITGRLMVGLRWWNYIDDDGKSHWVYESKKAIHQNRINDVEAKIFWLALVLTPMLWGILFIIALFGFNLKWILVVMIALMLNGANLFGYIRCRVGTSESITSVTSSFIQKQVLQNAVALVSRQSTTQQQQQPSAFSKPVNII